MDRSAVTQRVWELAEPLVLAAGLELVDVQYRPEGGTDRPALCSIDRPEGRRHARRAGARVPRAGRRPRRPRRRPGPLPPRVLVARARTVRWSASRALPARRRSAGPRADARARSPGAGSSTASSTPSRPSGDRRARPGRGRRAAAARPRSRRPAPNSSSRRPAGPRHGARVRRWEVAMLPDLNRVIEQVSKEKGIDRADHRRGARGGHAVGGARRTFGLEKKIEAQVQPRDRRGRAVRDQDRRRRRSRTPRTR